MPNDADYAKNLQALGECMARALSRPCSEADLLVEQGYDIATLGLIVLRDSRRRAYVPIYQGIGGFHTDALEVNRFLLARGFEPCRVVNWWHTRHPEFREEPHWHIQGSNTAALKAAAEYTLRNSG